MRLPRAHGCGLSLSPQPTSLCHPPSVTAPRRAPQHLVADNLRDARGVDPLPSAAFALLVDPVTSRGPELQVLRPGDGGYDGAVRWLETQLSPGDHQPEGFVDPAFDAATDTPTLYVTAKDVRLS